VGGSKEVLVVGGELEGLDAGTVAAGDILEETQEGVKVV
jgi:hypothetical protein